MSVLSASKQIELTGATRTVSSIGYYPVFKPGKCITSPQIGKAFEEGCCNRHVCFSIHVRALFLVHLFAKQDDTYIKHSNLRFADGTQKDCDLKFLEFVRHHIARYVPMCMGENERVYTKQSRIAPPQVSGHLFHISSLR